jgi:MtN3 and saliva related transmembrane protein
MFIEWLATVMGVLMSLGHFPQAYRVFKNRSAKDISLIAYTIFALGGLTWFVYGIQTDNRTIMISYAPGVIGAWLVLGLALAYRGKNLDPRD